MQRREHPDSLRAAEQQLRALPARRRRPPRAARRVGRWIAAGAALAGMVGVGALAAASQSGRGADRERRSPLVPTRITTTTAEPPFTHTAGVIATADGRWAIGHADDVVVVGDWDCDGVSTPALLRPRTGALYAFNEWAPSGRDVIADPLGALPGATDVTADDVDGDGCDDVVARTGDGEEMVFHPPDRL